jgi:hypothetical protein
MSHRYLNILGGLAALALAVSAGGAQTPIPKPLVDPKNSKVEIPRRLLPPPGMCRVWIENVPAGQQSAPTDCASAIRNRPPNGRVIFGSDSTAAARATKGQKGEERKPPKKPPA